MTSRSLARDEGGAIVVFGLFFAVLILGMLYYFVGIAATIYLRERMQDAADASAFAAAVVHARGMNTLALINMIMAAVLSVLVTLKLIEALIIIAEVILYALSWLGGATAAVASSLEVLRQQVSNISEQAEPVVQNVLKVLHVTGNVVKVITPVGANLSVLGKVANQYKPEVEFGVAMPPRFTLPVEDDEYEYLCGKAGAMSATLVMLPLSPILPSFVEDGIASAVTKLTESTSGWFCGDGKTKPPSYDVKPQNRTYPRSDHFNACLSADKASEDSIRKCKDAEMNEALSEPDKETGECRVGKPICTPEMDTDENGQPQVYAFRPESYCGSDGVGQNVDAQYCRTVPTRDGRRIPDDRTPYGMRLTNARDQCKPDGKQTAYWWNERELEVTWERDDTGAWKEVGEPVQTSSGTKHMDDDSKRTPCEDEASSVLRQAWNTQHQATNEWNTGDLGKPVCTLDEPKPDLAGLKRVTTHRREVTQVLGCKKMAEESHPVSVNPLNIGADAMQKGQSVGSESKADTGGPFKDVDASNIPSDLAGTTAGTGQTDTSRGETGTGGKEKTNMEPFRFEKGHKLGTSDMQIRSFVVGAKLDDAQKLNANGAEPEGETAHSHAKHTVELSNWEVGDKDLLIGLATASELWSRLAVAQAEYYFDTSQEEDEKFAKWHKADDGERDYLWYMGWTARMRRFRLSWKVDGKSADGESKQQDRSKQNVNNNLIDKIQSSFGGFKPTDIVKQPDELQSSGPDVPCLGNSTCEQLKPLLSSYDTLFLH
jgi:hypothetical protein